ncbi:hypothetical protein ET369_23760, partial [Salmonella enterica]|nr:hypothetical protein [Salmonella enterica]
IVHESKKKRKYILLFLFNINRLSDYLYDEKAGETKGGWGHSEHLLTYREGTKRESYIGCRGTDGNRVI